MIETDLGHAIGHQVIVYKDLQREICGFGPDGCHRIDGTGLD